MKSKNEKRQNALNYWRRKYEDRLKRFGRLDQKTIYAKQQVFILEGKLNKVNVFVPWYEQKAEEK